ncbi:MAG: RsbRD N-terminal domain-containing protein [Desulfobacterales bacterium]|nr:RsbRD N-terminal domain-containing protein [Desulfobacterales bacterium]
MQIKSILKQKQTEIIKQWFETVVQTYPKDTSEFLARQPDPFKNPVGPHLHEALSTIVKALIEGDITQKELNTNIETIVRIRAVQAFTPDQAVGFLFALKPIVRSNVKDSLIDANGYIELLEIEGMIDQFIQTAFNIYMMCREKICELRVSEKERLVYNALQKAGVLNVETNV